MNALLEISRDATYTPDVCPHCGAPSHPRLMIAHIQAVVAAYYKIPVSEMYSEDRVWQFSHPRQIAMYLAHELTPRSLPNIGRRFGGRHHTTVMYAISAVKARMAHDREVSLDVEVLRERLEAQ